MDDYEYTLRTNSLYKCPLCGMEVGNVQSHIAEARKKLQEGASPLTTGVACKCRGENPDCYRCDGLGFFDPHESKQSTDIENSSTPAPNPSSQKPIHTKIFSNLTQRTKRTKNRPQVIECFVCGKFFHTKQEIEKHWRSVHGFSDIPKIPHKTNPLKPLIEPPPRIKKRVTPPPPNLSGGDFTVIKGSTPKKPTPKNKQINQNPHRKEPTNSEVWQNESKRDATRLYAYNFRENGKFGSHSSHDNYDDESDAE